MSSLKAAWKASQDWLENSPRAAAVMIVALLMTISALIVLVLIRSGTENWNMVRDVLTILGAIASAVAAFLAARAASSSAEAAQRTLDYQVQLENSDKSPGLLISNAFWDNSKTKDGFRVYFVNLGQYAVAIRWFVHEIHMSRKVTSQPFELVIPAGGSGDGLVDVQFSTGKKSLGEFRFFFMYAKTKLVYHSISIPYKIETNYDKFDNGRGSLSQKHYIYSAEQKIHENLGTEKELLEGKVIERAHFLGFDGSTDIYSAYHKDA